MRWHPKLWLVCVLAVGALASATTAESRAQQPTFLIARKAIWKYSAGGTRPTVDWNQPSFDDGSWKSGRAGFGYGDSDDETPLEDMRNRYTAVYIRNLFNIERIDDIDSLYLYVSYDDGFIAYLNGHQVAAAAVKLDGDGIRVEQHEANGYELFVIHNAKALVRRGQNLLAIEGHNATPDSSDFSLDPILSTGKLDTLTVADYLADIDELEQRLLDQSSYLTRLGFDFKKASANLRRSINAETRHSGFVSGIRKLVMQIGDCHASVQSVVDLESPAFLAVRPADTDSGVAALGINLNQVLDPQCPFLESIDGEPLERWLDAAARFVSRGSPQLVHRRSLEWLSEIGLLREELKLPANDTVMIGLRSADHSSRATKKLRLSNQGYGLAQVQTLPSRLLDGNIGYLRIPVMDDRLVEPIISKIKSFRETKGLIIDVRDNSGGVYGMMRGIYGFFVPDDAGPYVTNIAAYRLSASFPRNHIEYRPTHRADWDGWNDRERAAIRQAIAVFRPEWVPPEGKFSDWHYMILSRERSGRANSENANVAGDPGKDYFYYDKPVVVLSNAGSFSATDGFLNAFAGLPQVTIVGEPSGGGSGATRQFQLPRTHVRVALSSMASFRPDGKLFDGRGIEVDIDVKPKLEDFTTGADAVLARGIAVISEQSR